jgi:hypothetical protein
VIDFQATLTDPKAPVVELQGAEINLNPTLTEMMAAVIKL